MIPITIDSRRFLAITLSGIVLLTAWGSTWFHIEAVGTYTQGLDREPTIVTEYRVDNSEESFEMSIQNSTPLIMYWLNRENVETVDESSETGESNPSVEQSSQSESDDCDGSCLDRARSWLTLTLFAMFCCFLIPSSYSRRTSNSVFAVVWLLGSAVILAAVPIAIAADFGISDDEEGDSATGGFDTNTQETVEINQFAHFQQDSDVSLSLDGITFSYESLGFDLGLVAEEGRESIIESPPEEGSEGYDSLIGFEGEMSIGPGAIVSWWILIIPLGILNSIGRSETLEEE